MSRRRLAQTSVDVLVVGGGPGGLHAARCLAREGFRVLVCEEHETVGDPVHCTGVIAADAFDEFDLPRHPMLNPLTRIRFVSPSGLTVGYSSAAPEAIVIDRGRFDRALAHEAVNAGAEVRLDARVHGLTVDKDGARGQVGGEVIHARLVVLACGASYGVQRRLGLGLPVAYLHTAQSELPATRLHDVEVYFGQSVAPSGFAWAVPVDRAEGAHVRVGVMASRDARGCFARLVTRVGDRWGIPRDGIQPRLKMLPLGAIPRTYAARLLTVGDAAGLVKPTTGGGIYYSIVSASLAADVGAGALRRDCLDAEALAPYEARWRSRLACEFEAQHALRRVATEMTDRDIDALFDLARVNGVMPLIRRTARFNEHRHLIRALFRHPPARRVLFRSLAGV